MEGGKLAKADNGNISLLASWIPSHSIPQNQQSLITARNRCIIPKPKRKGRWKRSLAQVEMSRVRDSTDLTTSHPTTRKQLRRMTDCGQNCSHTTAANWTAYFNHGDVSLRAQLCDNELVTSNRCNSWYKMQVVARTWRPLTRTVDTNIKLEVSIRMF